MRQPGVVAGVELGGTKSIALLADRAILIDRFEIPTTSPAATLDRLHQKLAQWNRNPGFGAIGIGSFGPIDLNPASAAFGGMLATPKPGWSGARVLDLLTASFDCPANIDTDVNAAALAEYRWGAGVGLRSLCYITIGTGVGGGVLVEGRPVHGAMHPEIGHIRIRRSAGDTFAGCCPFHRDCAEGLVVGPALAARFGCDPKDVADDHPGWHHVTADLGELIATLLLTLSTERVLIGGGVGLGRPSLLPSLRARVLASLDGYLPFVTEQTIHEIVRFAALGADAGPLGAVAIAQDALSRSAT